MNRYIIFTLEVIILLLHAGYYYDTSIITGRDEVPEGNTVFLFSAGHTKPITKPYVHTKHPPRKDYQLIYVAGGSLHYFDESGYEQIAPTDSFVLFKPLDYMQYCIYSNDGGEYYWCHFGGTLIQTLLKKYKLYDKRVITLNSRNRYIRIYNAMIQSLISKKEYYTDMGALLVQQLIITISQEISKDKSLSFLPASCTRVIKYLEEHYNEKITAKQLERAALQNSRTILRQFSKYLGISPMRYLTELRINKAKEMLLQSDYKVNEIALSVGFGDPLYFTTVFHKEVGLTPSEFKKNNLIMNR